MRERTSLKLHRLRTRTTTDGWPERPVDAYSHYHAWLGLGRSWDISALSLDRSSWRAGTIERKVRLESTRTAQTSARTTSWMLSKFLFHAKIRCRLPRLFFHFSELLWWYSVYVAYSVKHDVLHSFCNDSFNTNNFNYFSSVYVLPVNEYLWAACESQEV